MTIFRMFVLSKGRLSIFELVLCFALLAYPALLFAVKGGMNSAYAIITLVSLFLLLTPAEHAREVATDRTARLFALAMASGALAILVNQFYFLQFDAHPFDSELRFLAAIPVFLALRRMGNRIYAFLEYAFPLGVLSALAVAAVSSHQASLELTNVVRVRSSFMDSIHFGELALMLGFLSLFSINWLRDDPRHLFLLKLTGFAAGLYLAIQSGTRGSWVAVPVLLMLWYACFNGRKVISAKLAILLVSLFCLFSYFFVDMVQRRVDLVFKNLAAYSQGKVNNGTAARLELWKVSFLLLKEHPTAGIEAGSLAGELTKLRDSGIINDRVLREGIAEMHSEIAARMAKYGLFGLLSALSVYFVPMWLFARSAKSGNRLESGAGKMGVCLTLGFFVFGLTVETFNIKMVAAFYGLTVGILLAAASIKNNSNAPGLVRHA
jgi:O-antigen ligase